jgi:hypothetical protein
VDLSIAALRFIKLKLPETVEAKREIKKTPRRF